MDGERFQTPIRTFSSEIAPLASTALDRWALGCIRRSVSAAPIRFVLWDGFELLSGHGAPLATIVVKNRRALFGWLVDSQLNFGEAYMFGAVDIRGDLVALLQAVYRVLAARRAAAVVALAALERRARRA